MYIKRKDSPTHDCIKNLAAELTNLKNEICYSLLSKIEELIKTPSVHPEPTRTYNKKGSYSPKLSPFPSMPKKYQQQQQLRKEPPAKQIVDSSSAMLKKNLYPAYQFFFRKRREELARQNVGLSNGKITSTIASEWRTLNSEEKEEYWAQAESEKKQRDDELKMLTKRRPLNNFELPKAKPFLKKRVKKESEGSGEEYILEGEEWAFNSYCRANLIQLFLLGAKE